MSYLAKLLNNKLDIALTFKTAKSFTSPLMDSNIKEAGESFPMLEFSPKEAKVELIADEEIKKEAKVIFIVDVSGSVDYGMKEHFAGIQEGIISKLKDNYYDVGHLVILHHTAVVKVAGGYKWINDAETGGTIVSSGYKEAEKRMTRDDCDYYIVQLTDGDNWADDTPTTDKLVHKLALKGACGFKYFEIGGRATQTLYRTMKENDCVEVYRMKTGKAEIL